MIQLKFLKDCDDCLAGKESGTRVEVERSLRKQQYSRTR